MRRRSPTGRQKKAAPRRKYDSYGVPLPKRDPIFNPRPEKPVLSGAFLKKTMGELQDTSANLPVWFKDSSKKVADLRRLTPKEFEAYAARNSLYLLGPWTVGNI